MKNNCRKVLATLVLVLAFSSSAFADDGIIWPDLLPPPPANSAMHTDITNDGVIHTDWTDSLTEIGLSLVQALSRF